MPPLTGFNNQGFTNTMPDPRQAMSSQMTQQQQKKPWWTSLISELGGAGGAAAGAATGATIGSVVPVLGTAVGGLIGAAAGGFLGGTGGRLIENKVRDNKYNVGSALGEGATDAAFSGFSALNDVRKGAKAVKALSSVTGGLDNPQSLLQAPQKVGLIESMGKSLKTGASGYGIGAKVAGQDQLSAAGSDAVDNTLKTLKIPAGAPETQAVTLGNRITNIGKTIGQLYKQANVPVQTTEINNLGSKILGDVASTGGLGEGANSFALEQAQKLAKAKDINEVWQFTKDIANTATNFAKSTDGKMVDKEAAARIILKNTRSFLNDKVPGVAGANNLFHDATNAHAFILDAAKNKGGGPVNRLLSLAPVKAAEAKGGAVLENIGKASAGTANGAITGPASLLTNQLRIQAPGNLLGAMNGMQQSGQTPQQATPQAGQDVTSSLLGQTNQGGDVTSQLLGQPQQATQSGPSLDSLQKAIQQDIGATGGKNINNLMQLGQLYGIVDQQGNPVTNSGAPNVGKISAQQYGLAQSGRQSLVQLAQLLGNNPALAAKNATPGQGLPIVGNAISNIAGDANYHALADNVLSSLIHLQTGATATQEEITSAKGQLPGPNDDAATRQRKLNTLLGNFAPFLGSN